MSLLLRRGLTTLVRSSRIFSSLKNVTNVNSSTNFLKISQINSVTQQLRFFSSKKDDDNNNNDNQDDKSDSIPSNSGKVYDIGTSSNTEVSGPILDWGAPLKATIPEVWPEVPIIAINRYPLFPGFIKKVDIVKDERLKELLRRKAALRHPYVGVFVKKDDENRLESVESMKDLYHVGSFAQIIEMRDTGSVIELVLSANRKIRLLEKLDDVIEEKQSEDGFKVVNRLNVRRNGKLKREQQEAKPKVAEKVDGKIDEKTLFEDANMPKNLIYGKTENIVEETVVKTTEIKARMQAIVQTIRDVVQYNPLFGQQINLLLHPSQNVIDNPVYLCDLVSTLVQSAETKDLQAVMEEPNISKRLDYALELAQKEKTVAKLKFDISRDVEKKVQDQHRKYLLNEQLKALKKELGIEKEDKSTIIEKMEERISKLNVPEYAKKVIDEEKTKLSFLDSHSQEFSVCRNYLDWLTNIPWGKTSEESMDIEKAIKILDEDHYGMKDVKDRILEFIAVGIMKNKISGKILCFHGPPGVGKTSIARSIARSLNREYFRFSVGGLHDVAEIKGHRRTYIGAMPGKIVQALKKVQCENPLILIDEIDKLGGSGYHGDPASALLEMLDPEQNVNFNDHFLDVPLDLSKILFICTANEISNIPGPLKDRMEMIEVSGYVAEEKINIANSYLIPNTSKETNITSELLTIEEGALEKLIRHYCRESGVRNLQKHIEKIFRKAAIEIARRKEGTHGGKIVVDVDNLEKYVGRPKFTSDRLYEVTPPGVVMGLAWTAMGGSALYIETVLRRKLVEFHSKPESNKKPLPEGSVEVTGHLGDVMKESVRISHTVAKNFMMKIDPQNNFLDKAHLHVHVPEGATPKDGPSAGITITSSFISLALNKPLRQNVAMTGEISLTGKVLPVGGIREKIIAAKRAGITNVIIPFENQKDIEDLQDFIKNDIEIKFAKTYKDVYDYVFDHSKIVE
uniref:Lon protease homolog, mitochondrial n=1 Tax=Parastrongyloides trichosuri TaxID=131310 RepID=A0A0N4ZID6_PARTI